MLTETAKTRRRHQKYALSGSAPCIDSAEWDEIFEGQCAINIKDGVMTHVGREFTPDDLHLPFVNGATGRIEVEGAKPDDMVAVDVLDMKVEGLVFRSLWPSIGIFPDLVRQKEFGIKTQVLEVKDGIVDWDEKLELPVKPMAGVAGSRRCTVRCPLSTMAHIGGLGRLLQAIRRQGGVCRDTIDDCQALAGSQLFAGGAPSRSRKRAGEPEADGKIGNEPRLQEPSRRRK